MTSAKRARTAPENEQRNGTRKCTTWVRVLFLDIAFTSPSMLRKAASQKPQKMTKLNTMMEAESKQLLFFTKQNNESRPHLCRKWLSRLLPSLFATFLLSCPSTCAAGPQCGAERRCGSCTAQWAASRSSFSPGRPRRSFCIRSQTCACLPSPSGRGARSP